MIIYCAENILDGKKYVGFTTDTLEGRKGCHFRKARKNGSNMYFHNALRKHGKDNFKWSILYEDDKVTDDNGMETKYIIELNSHWTKWGYNMTMGGEGGSLFGELNGRYGMEVSDETKQRISKGKKGTNLSDSNPSVRDAGLYLITYPDGSSEQVKNLRKWTRDNGFNEKHPAFYKMCNYPNTAQPYQGYWCERIEHNHQRKVEKGITESTVLKSKKERREKFGI